MNEERQDNEWTYDDMVAFAQTPNFGEYEHPKDYPDREPCACRECAEYMAGG